MGFRFRKSVSLGKHARINIGKNGVNGVTFGSKGSPHVTVGKRGTTVGASIPGTGISYSQKISGSSKTSDSSRRKDTSAKTGTGNQNNSGCGCGTIIWAFIIIAVIVGCFQSCGKDSFEVPDVLGQTVTDARESMQDAGFTDITFKDQNGGQQYEDDWYVTSQDPWAGTTRLEDSEIKLTVKEPLTPATTLVSGGMTLTQAEEALTGAGYGSGDYRIEHETGGSVGWNTDLYSVTSVTDQPSYDGEAVITVTDIVVPEPEPETNSGVGDSETGASQTPTYEEPAAPMGTAHGGAFCSTEGATAQSDRSSSILTCKPASDGRLRWQK